MTGLRTKAFRVLLTGFVAASSALLASAIQSGCGGRPPLTDSSGNVPVEVPSGPGVRTGPCNQEGQTLTCDVETGRHAGIIDCFSGTQTCTNGLWGPCGSSGGTVSSHALTGDLTSASTSSGSLSVLSITSSDASSTSSGCANNPCDPYCLGIDTDAGGFTTDGGFSSTSIVGVTLGYSSFPSAKQGANSGPCGQGAPASGYAECSYDYCCASNPGTDAGGVNSCQQWIDPIASATCTAPGGTCSAVTSATATYSTLLAAVQLNPSACVASTVATCPTTAGGYDTGNCDDCMFDMKCAVSAAGSDSARLPTDYTGSTVTATAPVWATAINGEANDSATAKATFGTTTAAGASTATDVTPSGNTNWTSIANSQGAADSVYATSGIANNKESDVDFTYSALATIPAAAISNIHLDLKLSNGTATADAGYTYNAWLYDSSLAIASAYQFKTNATIPTGVAPAVISIDIPSSAYAGKTINLATKLIKLQINRSSGTAKTVTLDSAVVTLTYSTPQTQEWGSFGVTVPAGATVTSIDWTAAVKGTNAGTNAQIGVAAYTSTGTALTTSTSLTGTGTTGAGQIPTTLGAWTWTSSGANVTAAGALATNYANATFKVRVTATAPTPSVTPFFVAELDYLSVVVHYSTTAACVARTSAAFDSTINADLTLEFPCLDVAGGSSYHYPVCNRGNTTVTATASAPIRIGLYASATIGNGTHSYCVDATHPSTPDDGEIKWPSTGTSTLAPGACVDVNTTNSVSTVAAAKYAVVGERVLVNWNDSISESNPCNNWSAETNTTCTTACLPDFTLGVGCKATSGNVFLPVCNRGTGDATSGLLLVAGYPGNPINSGSVGVCANNGSNPSDQCVIDLGTKPITAGSCYDVDVNSAYAGSVPGVHCNSASAFDNNGSGNLATAVNPAATTNLATSLKTYNGGVTAYTQLNEADTCNDQSFIDTSFGTCALYGVQPPAPAASATTYTATCPSGTSPKWNQFAYNTSVPTQSDVLFTVKTAPLLTDGGTGTFTTAVTIADPGVISTDPAVCPVSGSTGDSGVSGCPKDLYNLLGALAAANPILEVDLTLTATSAIPVLNSLALSYDCVPSQ